MFRTEYSLRLNFTILDAHLASTRYGVLCVRSVYFDELILVNIIDLL